MNDELLRKILSEQKRTNELLAALIEALAGDDDDDQPSEQPESYL